MSEVLVTGEAVAVDVRLARLPSRALAFAVDLLVQLAALTGALFVTGALLADGDEAVADAVGLVVVIAVLLGYPVTMETLTRGQTLGKLVFGLRVVRDDGGPIRFRQALARGLFAVFPDIWLSGGLAAVITALLNRRGKRLGDIVAGTVVVQERLPTQRAHPVVMPPPLAGWAARLDLARLPDGLALAARQFLARAPGMDAHAREELGRRLVAAVAQVVSPPAPPGTPDREYLSAILAERRRREEARLRARTDGSEARPWPLPTRAPPAPPARGATSATSATSATPDGRDGAGPPTAPPATQRPAGGEQAPPPGPFSPPT